MLLATWVKAVTLGIELLFAPLHSRHLCHLLLYLALCGHVVEDIVEELQCPVQLTDALSW